MPHLLRRQVQVLDRQRVLSLIERERADLNRRTPRSAELYQRAKASLVGGVASRTHLREPWPIYLATGEGCRVVDVDGNQYLDFHLGFGSMPQGHAHPAIVAAITDRAAHGTHFAATTEDVVWVAEELTSRWGLESWAFVNSGTEATMDAIRIARAATGRETVVKIMGAYHGHHDAVMVSVLPGLDRIGEARDYASIPHGAGIPGGVARLTVAVPFNDADAMEQRIRALSAVGDTPACVIMEGAMTNLGLILPEEGYLERVRQLTHEYDVVLIFDEVKTGQTLASGGAAERFEIQPDMVTLAKSLGAGLPAGAIGGTRKIMHVVESGSVSHTGTFNGNPLSMAAARASLSHVLTSAGYDQLDRRNDQMVRGCQEIVERYGLPAYALGVGAKGGVTFADTPVTDYETFKRNQDTDLTDLAWLYCVNRGILMSPEREEEWTVSVAHGQAEVKSFVCVFEQLVQELLA